MDDEETDMKVQIVKMDSPSPSRAARGQLSNMKIANKPNRLIFLLCLVTFALIVILVGLSIHVSQIRQSNITSDRSYRELNSTLQSKISDNTHLDFSERACLKNLSALNSNLSGVNRMHNDLYHQFTEMETKYRYVNETKAQICELLTGRTDQTCSENWVTNKDRCYYFSAFETSLYRAIQECSKLDSRLLEINSRDEASFVSRNIFSRNRMYWIGKCQNRNVGFGLLYQAGSETSVCSQCDPTAVSRRYPCDRDQRFICEKSARLFRDVPEQIQDLCRQPVG